MVLQRKHPKLSMWVNLIWTIDWSYFLRCSLFLLLCRHRRRTMVKYASGWVSMRHQYALGGSCRFYDEQLTSSLRPDVWPTCRCFGFHSVYDLQSPNTKAPGVIWYHPDKRGERRTINWFPKRGFEQRKEPSSDRSGKSRASAEETAARPLKLEAQFY